MVKNAFNEEDHSEQPVWGFGKDQEEDVEDDCIIEEKKSKKDQSEGQPNKDEEKDEEQKDEEIQEGQP